MEGIDVSKRHILSLYRQILKAADKLPKDFQRAFVVEKAKFMFRETIAETQLPLRVGLAMTHLDDIIAQAKALNTMYVDDRKTEQQLQEEQMKKRLELHSRLKPDWAEDEEE
jgi:hypothetical protein